MFVSEAGSPNGDSSLGRTRDTVCCPSQHQPYRTKTTRDSQARNEGEKGLQILGRFFSNIEKSKVVILNTMTSNTCQVVNLRGERVRVHQKPKKLTPPRLAYYIPYFR